MSPLPGPRIVGAFRETPLQFGVNDKHPDEEARLKLPEPLIEGTLVKRYKIGRAHV